MTSLIASVTGQATRGRSGPQDGIGHLARRTSPQAGLNLITGMSRLERAW